jgi:NADPH-dependent curcumin reductase CurA
MAEGKIIVPNTVIDAGLESAVTALDDLLAGKHHGNVVVRLSDRG